MAKEQLLQGSERQIQNYLTRIRRQRISERKLKSTLDCHQEGSEIIHRPNTERPYFITPSEHNFDYAEGENQQFSSLSGKSFLLIITYVHLEFMNQKEID